MKGIEDFNLEHRLRISVFGQPILHYACSRCEQIPCEDDCWMRVRSEDICILEHVAMVFNTYAYDQHGLKLIDYTDTVNHLARMEY